MGLVDDFVELPFAIKFGILLLATLATTITFGVFNISELILIPIFNAFGSAISSISGFEVNTDYRLFVIVLFLIAIVLFINHFETSN